VEQKGEERKIKQAEIQNLLKCMDGSKAARERFLKTSETEPPPVLKGDPRIERIEAVVKELSRSYEMAEEEESEYTLSWRTIRGFDELAEKWNRIKLDGLSEEEIRARLKEILTALQEAKSSTIGSVELFEKLIEPENRVIWQHSGDHMLAEYVQEGYADNPLEAYVQRREWAEEVGRLGKPVHLTPADPRYSCRQVELGDKNTFKGGHGAYYHENKRLAVVAPLAIREDGIWKPQRVRIHYSAPRFLRDGLRGTEDSLTEAPWQQPMMEALGKDLSFPQDIHNHAVFLMPRKGRDGKIRALLNFPITLDPSKMVGFLGREQRWTGQFAGVKDKHIYLRWPEDNWGKYDGPRWYHNGGSFRVLNIDLGYRDAAGYSIVECGTGQKPSGVTREIGRADGRAWHARVEHMGMLHLPGEDMKVWQKGEFKQEPYGKRGRLALTEETAEAVRWVEELGYGNQFAEDITRRKGLPEQNDLLLVVLRRAIGRLRGWQSLSWKLSRSQERAQARAALQKEDKFSDDLKDLIRQGKWSLVSERLEQEIQKLKEQLSVHFERIANRVLPLKGRRWEWVKRPTEAGYVLRQTERGSDTKPTLIAGQRGLSMKRIEQIEELRRRCQALNRALQHTPGTPPKMGSAMRGQDIADPCPEVLEKLEHMKDQRVDQTAHLILAEALGVRVKPHAKSRRERIQKDVHGEYEKFREPVDFIVLEDLNRYRTSQERSRQENSKLMKWSHRAVLIKIKQLAETYGFPVLEVAAAYSSRFSSRDGCAGFRAREIHAGARDQFPWTKLLNEKEPDAMKLFEMLDAASVGQDESKPRKLLVPSDGGPIFVPMSGKEIQADINASINLGLRAVAAPDAWGIHHRVRTEMDETGRIKPLRKNNREKIRWPADVSCFEFDKPAHLTRQSNCFPVIGFRAEYENCTLNGRSYATGKGLWGTVKEKKWGRIREINESRIQRWREKGLIPPADDIKMS
jgi:IS605 OrfB family transposase